MSPPSSYLQRPSSTARMLAQLLLASNRQVAVSEPPAHLPPSAFTSIDWAPPAEALAARDLRWLDDVYSLVAKAQPDQAIDVLFSHVDDLLSAGRFELCDGALQATDVTRLDSTLIVALLSVTRAASHCLPYRPVLVARAERRLAELAPGRVERLIGGLR